MVEKYSVDIFKKLESIDGKLEKLLISQIEIHTIVLQHTKDIDEVKAFSNGCSKEVDKRINNLEGGYIKLSTISGIVGAVLAVILGGVVTFVLGFFK